jgi:hypothetical protein
MVGRMSRRTRSLRNGGKRMSKKGGKRMSKRIKRRISKKGGKRMSGRMSKKGRVMKKSSSFKRSKKVIMRGGNLSNDIKKKMFTPTQYEEFLKENKLVPGLYLVMTSTISKDNRNMTDSSIIETLKKEFSDLTPTIDTLLEKHPQANNTYLHEIYIKDENNNDLYYLLLYKNKSKIGYHKYKWLYCFIKSSPPNDVSKQLIIEIEDGKRYKTLKQKLKEKIAILEGSEKVIPDIIEKDQPVEAPNLITGSLEDGFTEGEMILNPMAARKTLSLTHRKRPPLPPPRANNTNHRGVEPLDKVLNAVIEANKLPNMEDTSLSIEDKKERAEQREAEMNTLSPSSIIAWTYNKMNEFIKAGTEPTIIDLFMDVFVYPEVSTETLTNTSSPMRVDILNFFKYYKSRIDHFNDWELQNLDINYHLKEKDRPKLHSVIDRYIKNAKKGKDY